MGKVLCSLKEVRESRLLTQGELAEIAKITVKSISKAETGHGVALRTVKKLAEALKVKPEKLMEAKNDA